MSSHPAQSTGRADRLRRCGFLLVNLWLVFHLIAAGLPAFSIPPSPQVIQDAYWALRFYPQLIYMDHGYHFFGPDPGDATLIRYVARRADGTTFRGDSPTKRIFPRLRYHRHFMLTEAMPRIDLVDPELYPLLVDSYARRIGERYDAETVDLYRVTHTLTSADRFLAGGRLDDPETYVEEHLGSFQWPDRQRLATR